MRFYYPSWIFFLDNVLFLISDYVVDSLYQMQFSNAFLNENIIFQMSSTEFLNSRQMF